MESPVVKKKWISPIWILPVVACLIGGWLLYEGIHGAGINIVIHFENAEGVIVGKTRVMYKGIPIGTVRGITVDQDMKGVSLDVEMSSRVKDRLVKDTLFWLIKPEISAGKISGLETLFSGSYIEARTGTSNILKREFTGTHEPPPVSQATPGLHIKLKTDTLYSIQRGSQIFFKNIPVGSVQNYILKDKKDILIDVYIKPEYVYLVKKETKFWNASGISFNGDISGFKLHMESISSLIYGGIGMHFPETEKNSPPVSNGHIFTLYPDQVDTKFSTEMTLILRSAAGLEANISKLIYRGFELGIVTDLHFNSNDQKTVTAKISIDPKADFILKENTVFWVATPKLSFNQFENMDTLVKGAYITFEPGSGKFCNHFVAKEQPNSKKVLRCGYGFSLISDNSSSFSIASPVFYKKLQVGEITGYDLAPDNNNILADFFIYEKYVHLVKSNSVFWKAGGVKINAGIDGITIQTDTISSLITGGVAFINPLEQCTKKIIKTDKKKIFTVYEDYQAALDATPSLQPEGLKIQLQAKHLKSISVGSPILYKQVKVGVITGYTLLKKGNRFIINAFVFKKFTYLLKTTSKFYNISGIDIKGGISGIHIKTGSLKTIIAGGIAFFNPVQKKQIQAEKNHCFTLYDNYQSVLDADKTEITITFLRPYGLKKDVELKYNGITIGKIKKVKYGEKMDSVIVRALVNKNAKELFRKDTKVWLVTPELSLSRIKNLDTIINGPYISISPGKGDLCTKIFALDTPPKKDVIKKGLNIILETPDRGSLEKNSPVYYRQIQIGNVTGYELAHDASRVWVYINIKTPYAPLVQKSTRFWNVSGIKVDAGIFSGIKINTESLESIIAGGIALATPTNYRKDNGGGSVQNGHHFILHPKVKKKWLSWNPVILLNKDEFTSPSSWRRES